MRLALASLVLMSLFLIGGCTTTIIPPPKPADPVTVYFTDYGRHSSLLLPDAQGHWTEYAFGDWSWFAEGNKSALNAVSALLMSKASALGRRDLTLPPNASDGEVGTIIDAGHVAHLQVPRDRMQTVRQELNTLHQAHIDTVTYNAASELWFVKYRGGYGLCHNCNHATATWLREMGCTIRGSAMLSKFRVVQ